MYAVIRRVLASGLGGRWLWVPDIARPDALLALVVAALVGASVALPPQTSAQFSKWLLVLPAVLVTGLMLLKLSAGMGLYMGASSAVGIVQAVLVRRGVKAEG
jgi:membrane protein insertase Oxa1/YidC/SpoIIIJ